MKYTSQILESIYSLGLSYFELGYHSASEKIFMGLQAILMEDEDIIDSCDSEFKSNVNLILSLIKIDQGQVEDRIEELEEILKISVKNGLKIRLALIFANIFISEFEKAKDYYKQIDLELLEVEPREIQRIYKTLGVRLGFI